jgi:hypothetical protein
MSEETVITQDPKIEIIYRKLLDQITTAWFTGDIKAAGRGIDALYAIVFPYITDKGKKSIEGIKFKPVTISDLYDQEDKKDLDQFGELEEERIKMLEAQRDERNRAMYYECRNRELKLLMEVGKELGLGFGKDVTLGDDEPDNIKNKGKTSKT